MATEAKVAGAKKAEAGKRKATARKRASKRGTKKPEDTETSRPSKRNGRSLTEEALIATGAQSSTMVERLMMQTMMGDAKSAHLLADLAQKEAEAKEVLDHGPLKSQALAWAAEPQWQDVVGPEQAETCDGSREAE
jgi:hypothetical protein